MKTKLQYLIIGLTVVAMRLPAGIAQEITTSEALTVAGKHLAGLGRQNIAILEESREIMKDDLVLAYVFDLDPPGYIVVGASHRLPPVVTYSLESIFGSMDEDNPLFTMLKADLTSRCDISDARGESANRHVENLWKSFADDRTTSKTGPLFEQWPATGDGWLKTNWTQSAPYNNFCPIDPVTGVRSYAGCPATAMAQIMNFHATTNSTRFNDADDYYHNYAGRQYWIDDDFEAVDFPGFPELNTSLDTLDAHYLNHAPLTADDKAALTFACGTAARQVYTSQGSGTFGVNQAYEAYQRFGCSTVALLDSNDADLFERLKQNIMDTLPAHLAVVDETWSTGHNVVVDGYNTDDYYHLNFGWGGSYNGWYLLPQEIPYELTVIEGIVVDIMKKLPTGIDESAVDSWQLAVRIFPNPTSTQVTIELSVATPPQKNTILTIYNLNGQQQLHQQIKEPQTVVDVTGLYAGIYFVKVVSDDEVMVGKFVKQ